MENDSDWVIPDGISEIVWVGKVSMRGLYSEDPVECFFNCGEYDYSGMTSWRNKNKDIKWKKFEKLRNIISHKYDSVDYNIIWSFIETNIEELKLGILNLREKLN